MESAALGIEINQIHLVNNKDNRENVVKKGSNSLTVLTGEEGTMDLTTLRGGLVIQSRQVLGGGGIGASIPRHSLVSGWEFEITGLTSDNIFRSSLIPYEGYTSGN